MTAVVGEQSARPQVEPLVLIVILNWNKAKETAAAVDSVLKSDYASYRILVIDNGSTEPVTLDSFPEASGDRLELVRNPINLGYTGGCNLGFKRALAIDAGYVWLLNNDAIPQCHTLSSLVSTAEGDAKIGLVSPLLASDQREHLITVAGGVCDVENLLFDYTSDFDVARTWREEHPGWTSVVGAALLVRVELIRKIGLLDDSLFAYYEDVDYSVRSAKAGYRNIVDTAAVVYHPDHPIHIDPDGVKPHYWYFMSRNAMRFWRKHVGWIKSLRPSWWTVRWALRQAEKVKGNPAGRQALYAGLWHGLWHKSGRYEPSYTAPKPIAGLMAWYGRRL